MPEPRKDETKDEFISRCMDSDESKRSFPDNDQRFAVCNSTWREAGGKGLPRKAGSSQ
ncbi:hypothetical protein KAR91_64160 [Candidatus Pacearchaeota archaeon]|nr:hypothetical protein [Candidatus Pacearchaeota archaeon]